MISPEKKTRVLITSAGGLAGVYLQKHLSSLGKYFLVGADMNDTVPRKEKWDAFYKTEKSSHPNYVNQVRSIIESEQIDVVIPVSSYDMDYFSKEEMKKAVMPAKMLVMDYETHGSLHDKVKCAEFLHNIDIESPKRYTEESISFPCIMKPIKSSGSRNVVVLESHSDYLYWSKKVGEHALFEYIDGDEYTVDCLFDENGRCVGYNSRKRVKMNGGGAIVSTCIYEKRLLAVIKKLEACQRVKGPVNFQYKIKNDEIVIFDFNTRFASGGLPLSVQAGFDIPDMLIKLALGLNVEPWKQDITKDGLTMLRYYEECFMKGIK